MVTDVEKAIISTVQKLRVATPGEIAANLGQGIRVVLPQIQELTEEGYLAVMVPGAPIAPAGRPTISEENLIDRPLIVTPRGHLEVR
jgi:hypothetical protein